MEWEWKMKSCGIVEEFKGNFNTGKKWTIRHKMSFNLLLKSNHYYDSLSLQNCTIKFSVLHVSMTAAKKNFQWNHKRRRVWKKKLKIAISMRWLWHEHEHENLWTANSLVTWGTQLTRASTLIYPQKLILHWNLFHPFPRPYFSYSALNVCVLWLLQSQT